MILPQGFYTRHSLCLKCSSLVTNMALTLISFRSQSNVPSFREAFSDHPHHLYVFLKNSSLYLYLVSREFILMAHTYNTNQVPGSVLNTSHILYVNMLNNFPKALQLVIDRAGIESKLLGSRIHYIIHTSM